MSRNVPKLRFKGFEDEWKQQVVSLLFDKVKNPVDVDKNTFYKQIGIRSHGKGIFYKEEVLGKELGNKRVFWIEPDVFIVNIVFAWERAIARTTVNEIGMIASHRFPMYKPKKNRVNLDYITYFFKTKKGQRLLELASPGGAGRNKTLGQKEFDNLKIKIPSLQEQEKISNFLSKVDSIIEKQEKKVKYWNSYKKGMMQKIFSQKIRFQDGNKKSYTDWEEVRLSYILTETNNKNTGDLRVCSVSVRKGVIDQIEHLGRSFAAKDTSKYKLVKKGDLIYTKSPTGEFPYGIIKQSFLEENVVVSPLYGVFKPKNYYLGYILHSYFYYKENTNNYLYSIVQKGAKNTINISNEVFLSKKLNLPTSTDEQIKIFNLLLSIDNIIDKENKKLEELKQWKKGLLQQMFV
ncbi:restriction endonuclease subunit S [Clostridium perfringens]|uniref:restriction endonuclease subunit S n=1 Tax=Clostridium perfringens TaxID=1502 RepID=UPI0024BC71A9|nr:restriction endonuclease subunit S [Clostridium perfringens]